MTNSPDFYAIAAQKAHNLPKDWQVRIYRSLYSLDAVDLVGAVPIGYVKRGPRKGKPRFPPLKDMNKVIISGDQLNQARSDWEQETGKCWKCEGEGIEAYIIDRDGEQTLRKCQTCGGTGQAKHKRIANLSP